VSRDRLDDAIDALLAAPAGNPASEPAALEAVLTEGYARALELEAERHAAIEELELTSLSALGGSSSPKAHRLRSAVSAINERLAVLRRRLDEANRRHRGSREEHLDRGSGSGS
jgi:hypothetical protein